MALRSIGMDVLPKARQIRSEPLLAMRMMQSSLLCKATNSAVVPAKAGTHTPCPSVQVARRRQLREIGGYGSPPSRGRHRVCGALRRLRELRRQVGQLLRIGLVHARGEPA